MGLGEGPHRRDDPPWIAAQFGHVAVGDLAVLSARLSAHQPDLVPWHGHEQRLGMRQAVASERLDARQVLGLIAVEKRKVSEAALHYRLVGHGVLPSLAL